jgi:hypothetical protein
MPRYARKPCVFNYDPSLGTFTKSHDELLSYIALSISASTLIIEEEAERDCEDLTIGDIELFV